MYNKILIPVDGSPVSTNAARQGLALAGKLGSEVTLLYVIDMTIMAAPEAESGLSNAEIIRKSFREHADKLLSGLTAEASAAGVRARSIVTEGDVHEEIVRSAAEGGAGLIVMGTHGRRGLNRLLLGSVAESVSRRAHCAVLLIRPE